MLNDDKLKLGIINKAECIIDDILLCINNKSLTKEELYDNLNLIPETIDLALDFLYINESIDYDYDDNYKINLIHFNVENLNQRALNVYVSRLYDLFFENLEGVLNENRYGKSTN